MRTIRELLRATPEEVSAAKERVSLIRDLESFAAWNNSPKGSRIKVTSHIGWSERSRGLHPSSFSDPEACLAKLLFEFTREVPATKSFSLNTQMTLDLGTVAHSMLQSTIQSMYPETFQFEVPLKEPGLQISSSADGVLERDGVRFVLEIKTVKEGGSYGYSQVIKGPFRSHHRQVLTYMTLADIPFGLVLYLNKNTGEMREHAVVWNALEWESIFAVVERVLRAHETGTKLPTTVGYGCQSCAFVAHCEEGYAHATGKNAIKSRARDTERRRDSVRRVRGSVR